MSDFDAELAFVDALSATRPRTTGHATLFGALLVGRIVRGCTDLDVGEREARLRPLLVALRTQAQARHLGEGARLPLATLAADPELERGRLGEEALRTVMLLAQALRSGGYLRCAHALLRMAVMSWPTGVAPHLQLECTYRLMQLELRGASIPVDGARHARLLARHAREVAWPEGRFFALLLRVEHSVRVGNLPRASREVRRLTAEARRLGGGYRQQVADLHAAVIAGRGGDAVEAARHAALVVLAGEGIDQLITRDASLILGEALSDLGFPAVAMRCFSAVAAATDDGVQRGIALVGLLAATVRAGSYERFVEVRDRIASMELLAIHRVDALVYEARGLQRFGEPARAREALSAAKALAEKYHLHQDWFEIESALARVVDPPAAAPQPLSAELSLAVEHLSSRQRHSLMTR